MMPRLSDNVWLEEQYINARRTLESIAQELGCNKGTVGRALRSLGIKARKRTSKYPELADYDWLYNAYVIEKKGLRKIAKEIGATPGAVSEHLKQKGIPRRDVREGMRLAGRIQRLGENGTNWKGGRRNTAGGYIYIYSPEHPRANRQGCVLEHRLVMEKKIGRHLESNEIVHHIDGDKQNNHPDNLELKTNGTHISEHFKASHEVKGLRKQVESLKSQLDIRDEYIRLLEQEVLELRGINR